MEPSAIHLAITLGDINGIGPEVALKAIYKSRWPRDVRFVFVGSAKALSQQAARLNLPTPCPWVPGAPPSRHRATVWDPTPNLRLPWDPGTIRVRASRAAAAWIEHATTACLNGRLDAMITAPICKEGLRRAGLRIPGHTELLARLTGTASFAMMLIGGPLRVVTLTRHVPLAQVHRHLSRQALCENVALLDQILPLLGCKRRRIAVCGLNPHAGDGGAIGREEIEIIAPAVRRLARKGYAVAGPIPSDVVFYQALRGDHDAVLSMYHDQGLGPLKMLAFEEGVNITLGLPIIRTSPDHGTAFDAAGENRAKPSSMKAAIKLAYDLASQKKRWPWTDFSQTKARSG
jgi:4-hydroxythreonine-4-phosphate dehydrogenase